MDTNSVTVFDIRYRKDGYSEEDIESLRSELTDIGTVRARGLVMPAAGGSAELWIVIEFIGAAVASGIIGHIATKFYETLSEKLLGFYRKRQEPFPPELMTINISYDDFDIEICVPSNETVEKLPEIISSIQEHLLSSSPSDDVVHEVTLPMEFSQDAWRPYNPNMSASAPPYPYRFWRVGARDISGFTKIYDSYNRKLINVSHINPYDTHGGYDGTTLYPESLSEFMVSLFPGLPPGYADIYERRIREISSSLYINIAHEGIYDEAIIRSLLNFLCHLDAHEGDDRRRVILSLPQEPFAVEKVLPKSDTLLEALLISPVETGAIDNHSLSVDRDTSTEEEEEFHVVGFLEPDRSSSNKQAILVHFDKSGNYCVNNATVTRFDSVNEFTGLHCSDGNTYFILPDDFRRFFRG